MGSLCSKKKGGNKKIDTKKKEQENLEKEENTEKVDNNQKLIFANTINGKKSKGERYARQDSYDIITRELGENISYFAVYDGHGEYGQEATKFVNMEIRKNLIKDRTKLQKFTSKEHVERYFRELFKNIHKKTEKNKDFIMSGSCAICVLKIEDKLYSINLGDSRAVIGQMKDGKKRAIEMSIDHKPSRDDEMKRIIDKGGEVVDKGGTMRIVKKDEEEPGLAVARTLGDCMGHTCGVSAEPEVIEKEIESDDAFIIIASDGVWDAMSSIEAVGFLFDQMDAKKELVAKKITLESRNRWELVTMYKQKSWAEFIQNVKDNESGNKSKNNMLGDIDDITAVIHFLND
jgi:integrin-linked kinase-associated serine/threonine phosphatase 2C